MVLNKSCILLIVISGMERFAFKGVASNLVTYLTDDMEMSNSSAAKFVNIWVGFTWGMPLIIATLADTYWHRYSTIIASSLVYATGLLALTSTAVQWPWTSTNNVHSVTSLLLSLYMISLGQGGYNPSLQAFGAEQLETEFDDHEVLPLTTKNDDQDKSPPKNKSLFFQWWYFGVCCGSLLGVSVMSYVQDTYGWGLGFAIPTFAMILSILMFFYGNRFYLQKVDSKVTNDGKSSFVYIVQAIRGSVSKMINHLSSNKYQYIADEIELEKLPSINQDSDPDPKAGETITPLEVAKIILRMLPMWLTLLIFAVIFQQPATFFTKQGMTMKRNIGPTFMIPPAALQSAITISIIVLMPFYDKLFIPFVRLITRNEKGISVMQRIGIGMFLSVVAMAIAAITERKRLNHVVPCSIFWLLPQYVLLGISDIFTVVGMQEYFYSEVPTSMRTIGIALYSSVFGVGSFLSALIICVIEYLTRGNSWFADDLNKGRLDKYYWFLSLAGVISLFAFVVLCTFFRVKA